MTTNSVDDWEDDWENTEIPNLILNLQETIKNRERELKLLEERRMMEEADLALATDLFDENYSKKSFIKDFEPVKNDKSNELKVLQKKKKKELQEKQKHQSQIKKSKKKYAERLKEIYGEAEVDKYDEMYGYIEDKYY